MSVTECTGKNIYHQEDNFQDRYVKLKNVAIKLKKQLAEQKAVADLVEQENKKLIIEREDQKAKFSNAQILQGEIDRMHDMLELRSKELKHRDSEVFETAKLLSDSKNQLIDSFQKIDSLSATNKELERKINKFEVEIENLKKINEDFDKKCSVNEYKLSSSNEDSVIQKELSAELSILTESYRQQSLSTELQDEYDERKMHIALCQLKEKDKTISALRTEIFDEKENLSSLKEQVTLVNDKANMESSRAESLMATVAELRKNISQFDDEKQLLLEENKANKALCATVQEELENEKLKSIEADKSSSRSEEALVKAKGCAELQIQDLEELILKQREESAQVQAKLSLSKAGFEAYKARAQSVLKQKVKISEDEYSQLILERQHIHAQLKDAENSIKQLMSELSTCKVEMVLLKSEKSSLLELNKSAGEEIYSLKESFQKETDLIREKLKSQVEENQQIVENLSMHVDITKNLKLEIESLKSLHSNEIDMLNEKINLLESSQTDVIVSHHIGKQSVKECEVVNSEEPKFDFSSMVREDGEGSECVESSQVYHSQLYHPPKLEHLIGHPLPAECHTNDDLATVTTDISLSQFNKLQSKVCLLERSSQHMSNLLAESESENVKLNQLCDVLKESIRNTSRRELREKQLENNEYLKNVLLKFLCLNTGDEKKRLVPVLQTILQLSPQETSSLLSLAAGDDSSSRTGAWSSYLHLWSNN